jgi:type I restriction enzyme R subunit
MTLTDNHKPEQTARRRIDEQLTAAGWKVVKYRGSTSSPTRRRRPDLPTAVGPMDYALVVHGKVIHAVEAKPEAQRR